MEGMVFVPVRLMPPWEAVPAGSVEPMDSSPKELMGTLMVQ
jgi:hypothetical protein